MTDLVGRKVVEPGHCRRGADGAPGAVRVDIGPRPRGATQPRANLVAGDHGLEEPRAVGAHLLGDGEGAGDDVDGRMAPAETIALVHLEGDARGRIGEGREERVRPERVADQRAEPVRRALRRPPGQARVLRQGAAGHDGAEGVEQHELGGRDRGRRQAAELCLVDEAGQSLQIVHQRTEPPRGAMGLERARNRPLPGFCSSAPPFRRTWPRSSVIHGRPRAAHPS